MKDDLRKIGFTLMGATLGILMLGLVAILMIPLAIGVIALAFALRGPIREALLQMNRRDDGKGVLEGEWAVLDMGQKDEKRSRYPH